MKKEVSGQNEMRIKSLRQEFPQRDRQARDYAVEQHPKPFKTYRFAEGPKGSKFDVSHCFMVAFDLLSNGKAVAMVTRVQEVVAGRVLRVRGRTRIFEDAISIRR